MPEVDRSFKRDLKNLDSRLGAKRCTKCGTEKDLSEFYVRSDRANHPMSKCKECSKKASMSWASNNREKTNKILREWRLRNPEKAKENCRQWAAKNPDKVIKHNREWYAAHKEQSRENSKRWYANNPQKQLESSRKWRMKYPDKAKAIHQRADAKQRSTPKGKLSDSVSRRMNKSLNGLKSHRHWEDIVDYTIEQLRAHLEKRFKPGMTWENYGTYWHIDHKTPVSVFNYERPEDIDFRLCWSLKNLQPMEAKENISKGARINQPFQPSLAIGGLL